MTSYFDYCLNLITNVTEIVQTATETIGNMLSTTGASESPKDPNNNKDDWVDLEKEHQEMKKNGQFLDENHPNYVCPSVDYDFCRDHGSYVVVYDNVHEPRMDDSFYVNN